MPDRFSLGFTAGAMVTATLVLLSLGTGDVLFGPALLLFAPGVVSGLVYLRGRSASPVVDEDERFAKNMRPRGAAVAVGCFLGVVTPLALVVAMLSLMFGGAPH